MRERKEIYVTSELIIEVEQTSFGVYATVLEGEYKGEYVRVSVWEYAISSITSKVERLKAGLYR